MSAKREESKINIVAMGILYFLMFAISFWVHIEKRVFVFPFEGEHLWKTYFLDIGIGLASGILVVVISYFLTKWNVSFRGLSDEFEKILGPLGVTDAFFVAAFSSLGEEFLFRGVIQGFWGIVPASIIFALLHTGPSKKYLPWTIFALVVGVFLGLLYEWRGNLLVPIVAHFFINFVNIQFLRFDSKAPEESK